MSVVVPLLPAQRSCTCRGTPVKRSAVQSQWGVANGASGRPGTELEGPRHGLVARAEPADRLAVPGMLLHVGVGLRQLLAGHHLQNGVVDLGYRPPSGSAALPCRRSWPTRYRRRGGRWPVRLRLSRAALSGARRFRLAAPPGDLARRSRLRPALIDRRAVGLAEARWPGRPSTGRSCGRPPSGW